MASSITSSFTGGVAGALLAMEPSSSAMSSVVMSPAFGLFFLVKEKVRLKSADFCLLAASRQPKAFRKALRT